LATEYFKTYHADVGHADTTSGRHGRKVWLGIVDSLQPQMKVVTPEWTDEQRAQFTAMVKNNILDPRMHLYAEM
jgi:hypothetical protein